MAWTSWSFPVGGGVDPSVLPNLDPRVEGTCSLSDPLESFVWGDESVVVLLPQSQGPPPPVLTHNQLSIVPLKVHAGPDP